MAKAITPTPMLEGEDKKRFLESLKISYSAEKEKFLNECKELLNRINFG